MEKGQIVTLKIDDLTNEGNGIGRIEGMAVFAEGALPGDTAKVVLNKVKKNYAIGRAVEILEESPYRIKPQCRYSKNCGGCSMSELAYEKQLELKEKQVRDKLTRIAKLDAPMVNEIVGMDEPVRYRNKGKFPVGMSRGNAATGFYQARSHEIVDCQDCLIQSAPAVAAAEALRRFMNEQKILPYDEKRDKGFIKNIMVRCAMATGEVMVVVEVQNKVLPKADILASMLDDAIDALPNNKEGVKFTLESYYMSTRKGISSDYKLIAGKPTITEVLGGRSYEISPGSFYQTNPVQTKVLYDKVVEYAGLTGSETVLDLYCGVGTIGLYCADGAGQVIGIESVKSAVIDANRNAVINQIVNARYILGRAEEALPKLLAGEYEESFIVLPKDAEGKSYADVVILDPPRSGCDTDLLAAVVDVSPERIVYVSCDPGTLARDVKLLCEAGYKFIETTPVDMFPYTNHVETVVLMSRTSGIK